MKQETPFTFTCQGATLVGMLHEPEQRSHRGVLFAVPYAPQSRIGVCRNLVLSARLLADNGITCMRFDQRGIGDSGGEPVSSSHMEHDIGAACQAFIEQAPWVEEIVIWGECNAASGAMICAWREPKVTGLVLQNPFVRNGEVQARAILKHHYWNRLKQKSFWLKVFKFQFSPWQSLKSMLHLRQQAKGGQGSGGMANKSDDWDPNLPLLEKMILGLQRFQGRSMLILSGRAMSGKELDELASMRDDWRGFMNSERTHRVEIKDGLHAFNSKAFREEMVAAATEFVGRDWKKSKD